MNWILDLDGVLWRGSEPIEGSVEAVVFLLERDEVVWFVTNNSLLTVSEYVAKMRKFGIPAQPEQIVTSALAAASLLREGERVLLIGGSGLREAIELRGAEVVESGDVEVESVLVGWDPEINFDKLTHAMRAIRAGARYIATNSDPTYPNPDGLLPGTGCIASAVSTASEVEPIFAGKPHEPIVNLIKSRLREDAVMVGDRISTDGEFASALGVHFGLVLSGVREEMGDFHLRQDTTICKDLSSLVDIYRERGCLPVGDFTSGNQSRDDERH